MSGKELVVVVVGLGHEDKAVVVQRHILGWVGGWVVEKKEEEQAVRMRSGGWLGGGWLGR